MCERGTDARVGGQQGTWAALVPWAATSLGGGGLLLRAPGACSDCGVQSTPVKRLECSCRGWYPAHARFRGEVLGLSASRTGPSNA